MKNFLQTQKTKIVNARNRPVFLRGVNLGGWLMMEGYILHSLNKPVCYYKNQILKSCGAKALKDFERSFRSSFITEKDIKRIAQIGFNCVRVPFHYGLIEKKPYVYDKEGTKYLDRLISWCAKNKIWVILDLHAACGAQNQDWHSDSTGEARLWRNATCQKRTFELWAFLSDRYKNETTIAGYDLLNEAVLEDTKILNRFYKTLIKTIRHNDKNHILFVEGNRWAMDLDCLNKFGDNNVVLSVHTYQPLDFTFNFIPQIRYPILGKKGTWGKKEFEKYLMPYKTIMEKRQRPIFVGEFGVNNRNGIYGEDRWLKDCLMFFKEFGFHWTYWTYKAIKNSIFPDGIFSYMGNPLWVNRQGPAIGMATYASLWKKKKKQITRSWDTQEFHANHKILKILKDAAR